MGPRPFRVDTTATSPASQASAPQASAPTPQQPAAEPERDPGVDVPRPRRGRPPATEGQLRWRNNRLRRDHLTAYDTGHRYTITRHSTYEVATPDAGNPHTTSADFTSPGAKVPGAKVPDATGPAWEVAEHEASTHLPLRGGDTSVWQLVIHATTSPLTTEPPSSTPPLALGDADPERTRHPRSCSTTALYATLTHAKQAADLHHRSHLT